MMDTEIKPAFTPEEWAAVREGVYGDGDTHVIMDGQAHYLTERQEAAIALLGYVTWDDVDRLRENAFNVPEGWSGNPLMLELANRIAALLPPREES